MFALFVFQISEELQCGMRDIGSSNAILHDTVDELVDALPLTEFDRSGNTSRGYGSSIVA